MYHEKAGGKWVFMCGAMPWRCKRKKQRISWERMLMSFAYVGSLIMYSYRFNCKPHMCTHTQTWRRENFQKSSVLKFSGKSFSDDSTPTQPNSFQWRFSMCDDSLSLENVLMKKPCVRLAPHSTCSLDSLLFSTLLWWKFHHASPYAVWCLMNLEWLHQDF